MRLHNITWTYCVLHNSVYIWNIWRLTHESNCQDVKGKLTSSCRRCRGPLWRAYAVVSKQIPLHSIPLNTHATGISISIKGFMSCFFSRVSFCLAYRHESAANLVLRFCKDCESFLLPDVASALFLMCCAFKSISKPPRGSLTYPFCNKNIKQCHNYVRTFFLWI